MRILNVNEIKVISGAGIGTIVEHYLKYAEPLKLGYEVGSFIGSIANKLSGYN